MGAPDGTVRVYEHSPDAAATLRSLLEAQDPLVSRGGRALIKGERAAHSPPVTPVRTPFSSSESRGSSGGKWAAPAAVRQIWSPSGAGTPVCSPASEAAKPARASDDKRWESAANLNLGSTISGSAPLCTSPPKRFPAGSVAAGSPPLVESKSRGNLLAPRQLLGAARQSRLRSPSSLLSDSSVRARPHTSSGTPLQPTTAASVVCGSPCRAPAQDQGAAVPPRALHRAAH